MEKSSLRWNVHHWLHWKLSKWQLPVQPVMKNLSKWRHFCFSADGQAPSASATSQTHIDNQINTLTPRQSRHHFADGIFQCIFRNENVWISTKTSQKFVPEFQINNIPAMVQIMAWHQLGNKPLSEVMMVRLLTHMCVTRLQWVSQFTPFCHFPNFTLSNKCLAIEYHVHISQLLPKLSCNVSCSDTHEIWMWL